MKYGCKTMVYADLILLALIVLYSMMYNTESFADIHPTEAMLPRINDMQIGMAKMGIKDIIAGRPDVINAAKEVLSDPEINPTVQDLLAPESGNERQLSKACGCQPENDCDCDRDYD
jgi:hypothetical protein